ncbi:hypothetical protein QR680_005668 [Steinernema hermaphroditum]|uniref:ZP domain-containing protein n=1 Tax=Steinernema hermaphroditum TaxID=289476 RepID=A0AA39HV40_9BILA|nr:hypothetical protein QR680_005668 [Steinernema hermaphroditum]
MGPLLLIPLLGVLAHASVCPIGTVATFFRPKKLLGNGFEKCVSVCGQENCSGIYLTTNGCLAMNLEDFFGSMDERRFLRKYCLPGWSPGVFVSTETTANLMGTVAEARDLFECAALCLRSTICEFVAFDSTSGKCFFDGDSNENRTNLPPTAAIHTRENVRFDAMCEVNDRAFALRPVERTTVYGTEKPLEGGFSREKCIDECARQKCAYGLYKAAKSKCSIFVTSENPEDLYKVKSTDYSIFENLCHSQVAPASGCPRENAVFLKDSTEDLQNAPFCLERCLYETKCAETRTGPGCASGRPIQKLCLSDAIDSDFGTLFEKADSKCPRGKPSSRIERISLEQCLEVCVTHPTQSCGGMNYHRSSGDCDLIDVDAVPKEFDASEDCEHFVHSVFQFGEPEKESPPESEAENQKKVGKTNWPFDEGDERESVNSNHVRRKPFQEAPTPTRSEISVRPVCDFGSMRVAVNASGPNDVDVFPKDQAQKCTRRVAANEVGEIEFGRSDSKCIFEEVAENVYSQLIVVKRNQVKSLPVITFKDLMFNVTCDYRNIKKTTVTEILHLKKNDTANNIKVRGRVDISRSPLSISLRSKRAQSVERVILGQQIELVFAADHEGPEDYSIPLCYATNPEGSENLTMIENGCPSVSVQRSLMIGSFRKTPKHFVLPFRAFKFANGSEVRIICVVESCLSNCARECDSTARVQRNRRFLDRSSIQKEIELTFTVDEAGDDAESRESLDFCIQKTNLALLAATSSVVFVIQLVVLFFIVLSHQKRRKTPLLSETRS